jgi:hypothetical protein
MSDSFFPSFANTLRSPRQTSNTFSQVGGFPRQRNVFIIRFLGVSSISPFVNGLTFAAKMVSRPHVAPKTEELNQYNKKRQIYTGFKLEPIRIQFYDSADGAAQNMWTLYSRYYFGDLNNQSSPTSGNASYAYDVTLPGYKDFNGTGFGFTARNGNATDTNFDAQYFFDRLEIYHFYDGYFDQYNLIHPKISGFEPDDLDYEISTVATITTNIVYENLQYFPQQPVNSTSFPEFQSAFNGFPIAVPGPAYPLSPFATIGSLLPSNPAIQSLLASSAARLAGGGLLGAVAGSVVSALAGGALSAFGNFVFGPTSGGGASPSSTFVDSGTWDTSVNKLASSVQSVGAPVSSVDGATWDVATAKVATVTPASGSSTNPSAPIVSVAQAGLSDPGGIGIITNANGEISLSPAALGNLNAGSTGTSNYGINTLPDSAFDQV